MTPLTIRKKFCKFIALVNYYHNMCARFSHMLYPLTNLLYIIIKIKGRYVEQKEFKNTIWFVAQDNLFFYPYLNKQF